MNTPAGNAVPINPHFWIEAIRGAMNTTDCADKRTALSNAADHLEAFIARTPLAETALRDAKAIRDLVEACEREFEVTDRTEDGELVFPDEDKVAFPEDTCNITFGHIRRARAAIARDPRGSWEGGT